MKGKLIYLLLLFSVAQPVYASAPVYRDTLTPPHASRWSQQQFLDAYGTDDTARALIRFYFENNRRAKRDVAIYTAIGAGSGIAFDQIIMKSSDIDVLSGLLIGLSLALLMYFGAIAGLVNGVRWIRFSRQRLRARLEKYRNTKTLPRGIYRNTEFKNFLSVERLLSEKEKG